MMCLLAEVTKSALTKVTKMAKASPAYRVGAADFRQVIFCTALSSYRLDLF